MLQNIFRNFVTHHVPHDTPHTLPSPPLVAHNPPSPNPMISPNRSLTDVYNTNTLVRNKTSPLFFKDCTIKITLQGVVTPNIDDLIHQITKSDIIAASERPLLNLYLSSNRITDTTLIAMSTYYQLSPRSEDS